MRERSQIRHETARALADMEEQEVADDPAMMTSHAGAQSPQAMGPVVERITFHCFRAPLTFVKEGIPIKQNPRLVGKLTTQRLFGRNISLHRVSKPAVKTGEWRWIWT